jgi:hypothetical protein
MMTIEAESLIEYLNKISKMINADAEGICQRIYDVFDRLPIYPADFS